MKYHMAMCGASRTTKKISLLSTHYRHLVQVLDYRRNIPLLADWSDELVYNKGCTPDVLFFTDGKP